MWQLQRCSENIRVKLCQEGHEGYGYKIALKLQGFGDLEKYYWGLG